MINQFTEASKRMGQVREMILKWILAVDYQHKPNQLYLLKKMAKLAVLQENAKMYQYHFNDIDMKELNYDTDEIMKKIEWVDIESWEMCEAQDAVDQGVEFVETVNMILTL